MGDAARIEDGDLGDRRASRLVGLGARVAAVAHEIKVPLSLIVGSLESLDGYVASLVARVAELEARAQEPNAADPRRRDHSHIRDNAGALVQICREGAEQLERIIEEIASYARGGGSPSRQANADLARLLRTSVDLVVRSTPAAPPVVLDVPDLPRVAAETAVLTRVLVNLVRNAFDALSGTPEPLVHIVARVTPPAPPSFEGGVVKIRIIDNGPGIPAAARDHVFEPFFTMKAFGAGLGLGLAISKELIEAQHGTIELAPASASGTEFVIRLPVAS